MSATRQGVSGTKRDESDPPWLIVKGCPAIITVPDLGIAPLLTETTKDVVWLPGPLAPETIVIQSALLTAVHAQFAGLVVRLTDEVPPVPASVTLELLRE